VFRAFSRVYVLLMPIMYGPYYVWLAEEAGGKRPGESGFALAVTFAVVVQLAVSGLVNLLLGLEGASLTSNTFLNANASITTNSWGLGVNPNPRTRF